MFQLCARMMPTAMFLWVNPATDIGPARADIHASNVALPCLSSTRTGRGVLPRPPKIVMFPPPTHPTKRMMNKDRSSNRNRPAPPLDLRTQGVAEMAEPVGGADQGPNSSRPNHYH